MRNEQFGQVVATDADRLRSILYTGGDESFAVGPFDGIIRKRSFSEFDFETR